MLHELREIADVLRIPSQSLVAGRSINREIARKLLRHAARLRRAMTCLHLLPATLSLVVLAAHFLRAGSLVLVLLTLVVAGLLFVRRPWAGTITKWMLVIGAIEWLRTLVLLTNQRRFDGLSYTRMALILASVGLFTLASAALVRTRRARVHFREEPAAPGPG